MVTLNQTLSPYKHIYLLYVTFLKEQGYNPSELIKANLATNLGYLMQFMDIQYNICMFITRYYTVIEYADIKRLHKEDINKYNYYIKRDKYVVKLIEYEYNHIENAWQRGIEEVCELITNPF